MHDTSLALAELGGVIFALGFLAMAARKIGLSPIPFYLVGGLAFGAGGLIPLEGIEDFSDIASEIGVILLLFLLGLEYSANELVTGMRRSWHSGVLDMVLNALPGATVALLLGWGPTAALVMAGITWVSSSGIIAKVLGDLGRLGNRETPVVLTVLVLEDLAMAIYLPIMTALVAGVSFASGARSVGIAVSVLAVVLVVSLRFGNVVSAVIDSDDPEVFLLRLFGAALLISGIASQLQVSAAVGAFLLGIAISGSTAENAAKLLEPIRDLFAALFFVVFGLETDPAAIPPVLGVAIALAVVTTVTKMVTGALAARTRGIGQLGQLRAGAALVARGEFSIVIAGLAVTTGAVNEDLAPLATAYVLLMAVIGPILAKFAEPVARTVLRRPEPRPRPAPEL